MRLMRTFHRSLTNNISLEIMRKQVIVWRDYSPNFLTQRNTEDVNINTIESLKYGPVHTTRVRIKTKPRY